VCDSPYSDHNPYQRMFDELTRALYRRVTRHVLLVGERGIGQSSLLGELAGRAVSGRSRFLKNKQIITVNARYVPQDESRATLAAILAGVGGREDLVVCIEGLASLLRTEGPGDNLGRLLSYLARVRCRIVGLVTPHEYEAFFAGNPDAEEFFSTVRLEEPDVEFVTELLSYFARGLEQQYRVTIDDRAIGRAVVLSDNFILNERLPYKALKILHSECEGIEYERSEQDSKRSSVTEQDVIKRVAFLTGIPVETLSGIADQTDYRKSLGDLIVGQDHAVEEVGTELGLIKTGLVDPGKPASVMLFVGPTGTGKTEMAKVLAKFYSSSKRLKTFTLGNFSEPHSVSGVIGVPAGYVGHDKGGRIVNELLSDPYSVFLLDEADKAHPDVMQPFLNLFDEGWVYDQKGVKAFADRAIFILTTNVGQRQIVEMCRQGKGVEEIITRMKETLSKIRHPKSNRPVFTAEFLARLKRVIVFRSLSREAMQGITQKLIAEMAREWEQRREKKLVVAAELIERIAEEGHALDEKSKGKEGGRVIRKLIADRIEAAIQQAISENASAYRDCGTVSVGVVIEAGKCGEAGKAGGADAEVNEQREQEAAKTQWHAEVRFA